MGKVNVYLPDDLEAAVREAGLSISPICQEALRRAVDEVRRIRATGRGGYTAELTRVLDDATREATGPVGAGEVAARILFDGDNLGARVLAALGVELPAPRPRRAAGERGTLTDDALDLLTEAYRVAVEMRHPHVGTEHVVIALAQDGGHFADTFAALGIDARSLRQQTERLLFDPRSPGPAPAAPDPDFLARVERELHRLAAEVDRLKGER